MQLWWWPYTPAQPCLTYDLAIGCSGCLGMMQAGGHIFCGVFLMILSCLGHSRKAHFHFCILGIQNEKKYQIDKFPNLCIFGVANFMFQYLRHGHVFFNFNISCANLAANFLVFKNIFFELNLPTLKTSQNIRITPKNCWFIAPCFVPRQTGDPVPCCIYDSVIRHEVKR